MKAMSPDPSLIGKIRTSGEYGVTEIRKDPLTGKTVIVAPYLDNDNFIESQIGTDGKTIANFHNNGATVKVTSPKMPLFLLEEHPEIEGHGIYDRKSAFGADERFSLDRLSPSGLELLINVFKVRSLELQNRTENGSSLRQFYPYATYNADNSSLTGRLLATREIAPQIQSEIILSEDYFGWLDKNRCVSCDMIRQERDRAYKAQTRVLTFSSDLVDGSIAFVPFAPEEAYSIHIFPFAHKTRLIDLSEEQIKDLTNIIYQSLESIIKRSTGLKNDDNINIALHSGPTDSKENGRIKSNVYYGLNDYYHFHIEISRGKTPVQASEYKIPESGWTVIQGRPKDKATELRKNLNNHP